MTHRSSSSGFTLVELAIAILITGLILAGGITLYDRAQQQKRYQVTRDHIDAIVNALSVYAETAGRIPCAADPSMTNITFGWENGVTLQMLQVVPPGGGFPIPTDKCAAPNNEGIVPFLSLNLDPSIALDGWGRYFTYAVSPQFARTNDQSHVSGSTTVNANQTDKGTIHGRCRTAGWQDGVAKTLSRNAVKARFCCDDADTTSGWNSLATDAPTDIRVLFTDQATILSPTRESNTTATGTTKDYDFISFPCVTTDPATEACANATPTVEFTPTTLPNANGRILTPAFIVISHGPNGAGAYLANGNRNRYNPPAAGPELENANNDGIYIDGPANFAAGNAHFDDIVRWMTQDSLMAAHGALSCQYP